MFEINGKDMTDAICIVCKKPLFDIKDNITRDTFGGITYRNGVGFHQRCGPIEIQ